MNIFKVTHTESGKVYIGYSINNLPNYLGSGKYIKRAVRDFGKDSFKKEVLHEFDINADIHYVTAELEKWIGRYKSDDPKFGYNEKLIDLIPSKKKLTKKIQVLLAPEDEDSLNNIIIEKSMLTGTNPISISRYVRQLIVEHIVNELKLQ